MPSGNVGVHGVQTSIFLEEELADNERLSRILSDLDAQQDAAGYYQDKSIFTKRFIATASTAIAVVFMIAFLIELIL